MGVWNEAIEDGEDARAAVHKPTFRLGYRAAASRALGGKQLAGYAIRIASDPLVPSVRWCSAVSLPRRCGGFACRWADLGAHCHHVEC
jgi:hypothetical protein